MSSSRRPVVRTAIAATVLLPGMALGACGSAAAPSPPSGVDGLVIPTPDPTPSDFVASVDNPWLPLAVGSRRVYVDLRSEMPAFTVTVEKGPEIAGIATTTAVRTNADGSTVRDHFAQDRAGNVWWFGHEDPSGTSATWQAGTKGAEAGLAMPAHPRLGDGFRTAVAPGLDQVATVAQRGEEVTVPHSTYTDTVEVDVADDGVTHQDVYAKGVGLVRSSTTGLADFDEAR